MPENGEINKQFGVYRSLCCGREIVVREGATFPDCPRHIHLSTVWKLIEAEIVETKEVAKRGKTNSAA